MNTRMASTHFISLPDVVLLEIFAYFTFEDALYAFADLHDNHLIDLLTECGAFRHICLSSQLSRRQYRFLLQGIWRYDLVRSFVCKEMFSDFIIDFTPCQIFPSLTELRILCLRCPTECLTEFVIAHSPTLTHFIVTRSEQSYIQEAYQTFLQTLLPHFSRLTLLDTDWRSHVSIQWNKFVGCLQSLENLFTFVESMSDVYALATDGFFPRLRSLRVYVNKAVLTELPVTTSIRMPKLETFDLYLTRNGEEEEEEEKEAKWATVETLTSYTVMPRLRRCSLVYDLSTSTEILNIFQSPLFGNDERHIRVRFVLCLNVSTFVDSSDITNIFDIRSVRYGELFVKYNEEDKSNLHGTWFTQSWPSWTTCWMDHHDLVPRNNVHRLGMKTSNTLLHSIGKLFPDAKELVCMYPASLSVVDSLIAPTPLANVRHLTVLDVVPGLEFLLDGVMLPRLRSLSGLIIPLFVAFASRANQMRTLDTIDYLMITDQADGDEKYFSLKQWYIILDALPRLRTLLVQIHNAKCPPMAMADLFIDYIRRTTQAALTLFSCCIDHANDMDCKEHFITYLEEGIKMICDPVQLASLGPTRLDVWL